MIIIENLFFKYTGQTPYTLSGVNLLVPKGSYISIVGNNGCGKSTLSKLFNALLLPTKGDVFVDGMNTKYEQKTFEIRKNAGMIFQNPDNQMVATLVEEEIAFGPENLGVPRDEIRRRVDAALQAVHMQEYLIITPVISLRAQRSTGSTAPTGLHMRWSRRSQKKWKAIPSR